MENTGKDQQAVFSVNSKDKELANNLWIMTLTDLYLVILVFFILLNSIALSDKAKNDKAVNSINNAFTGTRGTSQLNISPQLLDFPSIIDNYFKSIEELLQKSLRIKNLEIKRTDSTMVVTIPKDALFDVGSVVIKDSQAGLLKKLEAVVDQDSGGAKISIEIKIEAAASPEKMADSHSDADIKRLSALIEELVSSGVRPDLVSGAVSFSGANNIMMIFNVAEAS